MKLSATKGKIAIVQCIALFFAFAFPVMAASEIIFQDDFETGDFLHSENGFKWAKTNRTSIVRDDGYVVNNGEPIETYVAPGNQWENAPDSDGRHAIRFRYPAGSSMAEQRFSLGGVYPEIWISYWIRVPTNYIHGTIGAGQRYRNQKWFALWTDNYSGSGQPVVVFNIWDYQHDWNEDETEGSSYTTISISNATDINSGHYEKFYNFIRFPNDQGRWMHIVARYKIASSRGAEDGIVQWWRRWENEGEYTVLSDRQDLGIGTDTGPKGFTAGYILGHANGAYEEDTEFLVDDFKVSTTNLLDPGAVPQPPKIISVE